MYSLFFLYYFGTTDKKAMFWLKSVYTGACFSSVLSYHFVIAYLNIRKRPWVLYLFYSLSALFLYFVYANKMIGGIHYYACGPYAKSGKYHSTFILYMLSESFYTLYLLYDQYKHRDDMTSQEVQRVKYVFLAWILGHFALLNFLPVYGINIFPLGNFFMGSLILLLSYAILRHQLLDINVIIKKTLVYSILISIITIVYFIVVYLLERFSSIVIGYRSIPLAIAVIAFFTILFIPLKNKIQRAIDKHFFKGTIYEIDKEKKLLERELERSERLKTVSHLAAGMAHEIKNPLTSIKTFVEYIDKKYEDPQFKERFKKIVPREIDKISNIISQLLDYSKTDRTALRAINIHNTLDYVLDLHNNEFIKKHIKVEKHYNSDNPTITCDENQIKQALINIILNSMEAMPRGGDIAVETKDTDNSLEISIKDTGSGIPQEKLKDIFNPFYTTKDKGTGLGLFIVHQIIENNRGIIAMDSELGKGTRVRVRFLRGN